MKRTVLILLLGFICTFLYTWYIKILEDIVSIDKFDISYETINLQNGKHWENHCLFLTNILTVKHLTPWLNLIQDHIMIEFIILEEVKIINNILIIFQLDTNKKQ